jgi:hypothetical protein
MPPHRHNLEVLFAHLALPGEKASTNHDWYPESRHELDLASRYAYYHYRYLQPAGHSSMLYT